MLCRASLSRTLHLPRHAAHRIRPGRPLGRQFSIQHLCDGFLDLAIALPYPQDVPIYSATIILVTLASRFALLPASIWAKQRARRFEENVLPELRRLKPLVERQEFEAMQRERIMAEKPKLQKIHNDRCREVMKVRQKELCKIHKCSPLITTIAPVVTQMPIFVAMTYVFARLAVDPTSPFDTESFLTLTTLNHPDPTMTLPVVLGLLSMANVDAASWAFNSSEIRTQKELQEKKKELAEKQGARHVEPNKIVKSVMRVLSVGRIGLGAIAPGSVVLYWVTSAGFGLIQSWVMASLDVRRKRHLYNSSSATLTQSTSLPSPTRTGSSTTLDRLAASRSRDQSQPKNKTSTTKKPKRT